MSNIHSTSIIHKSAKISPSTTIGPFCVIEENVEIEEKTVLESHIRIGKNTKIGKENKIYQGTNIGGSPQDLLFDEKKQTALHIGNNNVIKEGCVIHRATQENSPTKIGNSNFIMNTVHIAHDIKIGNENIIVSNTIIAGYVQIQNKVFISGLVGIHQFCRIGSFCMIGGCSKIVKDVPPYATADGNPAIFSGMNSVGLRRVNFSVETRKNIKQAYKIIYNSNLNTKQAIQKMKQNKDFANLKEIHNIIEFFEHSHRGVL